MYMYALTPVRNQGELLYYFFAVHSPERLQYHCRISNNCITQWKVPNNTELLKISQFLLFQVVQENFCETDINDVLVYNIAMV